MAWRSLVAAFALTSAGVVGQGIAFAADYPAFDEVVKGYEKIDPPSDSPQSMYTI